MSTSHDHHRSDPRADLLDHLGEDHDTPIWHEVAAVLARYDADLDINAASACAWSGQLRLTLTDPHSAPSRSIAFHSTGAADPADVADALLEDFALWRLISDVEPLPVPEWMTTD